MNINKIYVCYIYIKILESTLAIYPFSKITAVDSALE